MKLSYYEQGTGQTIVFLHGFPMDHTFWAEIQPRLSPDYHVVTPDLRGFGDSPSSDEKTTMETYADDIANFVQKQFPLKIPFVLCGLSMGGYIAMQFVRKYQHLLAGLILSDTRTKPDPENIAANRKIQAAKLETEGAAPLVDSMLPRLFSPWTLENEPEIVQKTKKMMIRQPIHGIAAAARGMAERPDTTFLLDSITCPTLVVCGEKDTTSPPDEMLEIAQLIPNSTFVEIPKAGHLPPVETPQHFTDVVRKFLQNLR